MTKRRRPHRGKNSSRNDDWENHTRGPEMIFDHKPTVISRPRVTMIEDSTLFQVFKIEKGEAVPDKVSKMTLFAAMAVGFCITIAAFVLWEYCYG